jgi:hypothetical protein
LINQLRGKHSFIHKNLLSIEGGNLLLKVQPKGINFSTNHVMIWHCGSKSIRKHEKFILHQEKAYNFLSQTEPLSK